MNIPSHIRSRSQLKQASQWHDKRFTPWHAIWRANEGRTRDRLRGDAAQVKYTRHIVAKILKCSIFFQRCHDLSPRNCWVHVGCHVALREQFVTYAWQMARRGANCASPCRLDRLRATKMARLGTPCCGILREQNSCQCQLPFAAVLINEPRVLEPKNTRNACRRLLRPQLDIIATCKTPPEFYPTGLYPTDVARVETDRNT